MPGPIFTENAIPCHKRLMKNKVIYQMAEINIITTYGIFIGTNVFLSTVDFVSIVNAELLPVFNRSIVGDYWIKVMRFIILSLFKIREF